MGCEEAYSQFRNGNETEQVPVVGSLGVRKGRRGFVTIRCSPIRRSLLLVRQAPCDEPSSVARNQHRSGGRSRFCK